jgi:hypothetical protein
MSAENTLRRLSAKWLLNGPAVMERDVQTMPAKEVIAMADHYGIRRSRSAVWTKVNEVCTNQLRIVNQSQMEAK